MNCFSDDSAMTGIVEESGIVMSSGARALPLSTYHRAQSLGEGTIGSVVPVYNNEGEEYALKLFLNDDNEENDQHLPLIAV